MFYYYQEQQLRTQEYIESGILETFVLGAASEQEVKELLFMKAEYPEVNEALQQLEKDIEKLARNLAVEPPSGTWYKIAQEINAVIPHQESSPQVFNRKNDRERPDTEKDKGDQYIEVEGSSSHMRLHKAWRWVFAGVFILGKIFLAFAIYFYLENKHTQQQIQELRTEIRELKNKK
ncbi:hypothetical protein [Mucilaginibacter sp.]|uniref:hypothetical protein n=1 Tax=Mucilaginibacter sp. TaxID=1882438 RepID=UPI0031B5A4FD